MLTQFWSAILQWAIEQPPLLFVTIQRGPFN